MSETKCNKETRIEVKYDAGQFIKALFGECSVIAKQYVQEHPKEFYGVDDFIECYRIAEIQNKEKYGPCEPLHDVTDWDLSWLSGWKEDDISFDRAYKLYEENGGF